MSSEAARRWSEQRSRKRRGETSDADAAFKKVRYSAESRLPPAKTRRMIVAHFQENDGLSVLHSTYRVSLLCPLVASTARIFNASTWNLKLQVQTSLWACPIAGCSKQLRLAQLRVDQYFCDTLEALADRTEITEVDLHPNGDYAAVEPRHVHRCEVVPDDGTPYVSEPVEPKREPLDASNASATPARDAPAASGSGSADPVDVIVIDDEDPIIVIDDEDPMPSSTTSRRRQRKSGKRRGLNQKETDTRLDSLATKAVLNRREEQLKSANEEIQHLREELAVKERQERVLRQNLFEADADRARLRQSLEEVQRPAPSSPCDAIRSLQEQIASVQRGNWALKSGIVKIEAIESDLLRLEATAGQISADAITPYRGTEEWDRVTNPFDKDHSSYKAFESKLMEQRSLAFDYRYLKKRESEGRERLRRGEYKDVKPERIDAHQRKAECCLADARALRIDLIRLCRKHRLGAMNHEELALLRERLEKSEQHEQRLREELRLLSAILTTTK